MSKLWANLITGGFARSFIHRVTESHPVNQQKTLHYIKKTRRCKHLITRLFLHLEKINLT